LLPKQITNVPIYILHRLYSWCFNWQCLYWRHCWHIIWADLWCILH